MIFIASCATDSLQRPTPMTLDDIANEYVRLVLALGHHDEGYVDAYYGPEALASEVAADTPEVTSIAAKARSLAGALESMDEPGDEMLSLRRNYLIRQLRALEFRTRMLSGERFSFDEESAALYGAVAPHNDEAIFQEIISRLDTILPGTGPVADRYLAFRKNFVIPPAKLDEVFVRSIEECRARTAPWLDLPEGESFTVEYVGDKPWSGYNWYQGGFNSLIQVNADYDIYVDRAIDLACHEGYPGHHVYNAMLEKNLARDRGWIETTVYPLYSPQSLIAEGSANYGIEMAFPGEERTAFERDVLYPIAGLDPSLASRYAAVRALVDQLGYAGNEAARRYLDGEISREEAAEWLETYALSEPDRALQRTRFFDTYRSYVINYNLGKDLVRQWVESHGESQAARWAAFRQLLSTPRLPQDLEVD